MFKTTCCCKRSPINDVTPVEESSKAIATSVYVSLSIREGGLCIYPRYVIYGCSKKNCSFSSKIKSHYFLWYSVVDVSWPEGTFVRSKKKKLNKKKKKSKIKQVNNEKYFILDYSNNVSSAIFTFLQIRTTQHLIIFISLYSKYHENAFLIFFIILEKIGFNLIGLLVHTIIVKPNVITRKKN